MDEILAFGNPDCVLWARRPPSQSVSLIHQIWSWRLMGLVIQCEMENAEIVYHISDNFLHPKQLVAITE